MFHSTNHTAASALLFLLVSRNAVNRVSFLNHRNSHHQHHHDYCSYYYSDQTTITNPAKSPLNNVSVAVKAYCCWPTVSCSSFLEDQQRIISFLHYRWAMEVCKVALLLYPDDCCKGNALHHENHNLMNP